MPAAFAASEQAFADIGSMQDVSNRQTPFYKRKPSRLALSLSAALLAALAILVILFEWNWLKGPIERAVQARTGRAFHTGFRIPELHARRKTILRPILRREIQFSISVQL